MKISSLLTISAVLIASSSVLQTTAAPASATEYSAVIVPKPVGPSGPEHIPAPPKKRDDHPGRGNSPRHRGGRHGHGKRDDHPGSERSPEHR
ncbi:hypothetical protein BGZ83_008394, partial [Gryganskiella cystojenkinii]